MSFFPVSCSLFREKKKESGEILTILSVPPPLTNTHRDPYANSLVASSYREAPASFVRFHGDASEYGDEDGDEMPGGGGGGEYGYGAARQSYGAYSSRRGTARYEGGDVY